MNGTCGWRNRCAGIAFSLLTLAGFAASSSARAWSEDVITNCTGDYLAYCKQHSPESTELRYCMEAHRDKISKQCISALVDAGEVPKKYLANVPQSQQPKK
jgi:hypothetical protein